MVASSRSVAGPSIDGFSWVEFVGRGGHADVHRYVQQVPEREVAIKVVSHDGSAKHKRILRRESNVLAQVSSHPGIVSLYLTGRTRAGDEWMALEYCPRRPWRRGIAPLSVVEVVRTGVIVAGAVASLHAAGIAHRDIKPSNILVTKFNQPVLTDFGLSGRIGVPVRHEDAGMSIPWAAPEAHAPDCIVTPALDVYSLAATLWTWLVGCAPCEAPGEDNSQAALISRVLSGRIRRTGRRDVPESLELLLARGMALSAEERPSASDFGRLLQQVQKELGLPLTTLDVLQSTEADDDTDEGEDPDATRPRARIISTGSPTHHAGVSDLALPDSATGGVLTPGPLAGELAGAGAPVGTQNSENAGGVAHAWASTGSTRSRSMSALPPRSGMRWWHVLAVVVAVACVMGGIVLAVLQGDGWTRGGDIPVTPQEPTRAVDVVEAPVPAVTNLKMSVEDETVSVTWRAPDELPDVAGAPFGYVVSRAGEEPIDATTSQTTVTFPVVDGRNCIEVWVRGLNGRVSESQHECIVH
ncbi:MAG: serine/threonine-protein kinase [Actinomycetaceae bacterium]|nr:serine/threonine-protein kinase [Actinomycetaceae bacterium]